MSQASAIWGSEKDLARVTQELSVSKTTKNIEIMANTQVKEKEKSPVLKIQKLQMALDQLIFFHKKTLEKYPLSKYQEGNNYPIDDPGQSEDITNIPEETESVNSDKTEIYWPLDVPKEGNKKPLKCKPVKVFNIHMHGDHKRKPKYYFRCQIYGCQHYFYTLKGWNLHH